MKKLFLVLGLVVLTVSCQSLKNRFSSDVTSDEQYEETFDYSKIVDYETTSLYEVTNSDSLDSIARKHGTRSSEIISMNNLEPPYDLKPGMILKVPTIRTVTSSKTNEADGPANNNKIILIKPAAKKTK
jgi:LysM repeat protein